MGNNSIIYGYKIKDSIEFDVNTYSAFKFGSGLAARKMAEEIAPLVWGSLLANDDIVVTSSAYVYTKSASAILTEYVIKLMNETLVMELDRLPVRETRLQRFRVYPDDYGALSAEERVALLGPEKFYIDRELIRDKQLLVIDDIRVTGLHEEMVMEAIGDVTSSTIFLYYAMVDEDIPAQIESQLNFHLINSMPLLIDLMVTDPDYRLTMRGIKMIMASKENEFVKFLNFIGRREREQLYYHVIGDNCHRHYLTNFEILKAAIEKPMYLTKSEDHGC